MTPRDFLENVVRPNLQEFDAEYGSIRRAHNAVATVDALAAHIYVWFKTNAPTEFARWSDDSHYRGYLAQDSEDFRLLRDIAKAQKHVKLDPDRRAKTEVTTAAQVTTRSFAYGKGDYNRGRYSALPQVVVRMDSGELRYVEQIVTAALAVLEEEMKRLKI